MYQKKTDIMIFVFCFSSLNIFPGVHSIAFVDCAAPDGGSRRNTFRA